MKYTTDIVDITDEVLWT